MNKLIGYLDTLSNRKKPRQYNRGVGHTIQHRIHLFQWIHMLSLEPAETVYRHSFTHAWIYVQSGLQNYNFCRCISLHRGGPNKHNILCKK